jgi:hypothetical protein
MRRPRRTLLGECASGFAAAGFLVEPASGVGQSDEFEPTRLPHPTSKLPPSPVIRGFASLSLRETLRWRPSRSLTSSFAQRENTSAVSFIPDREIREGEAAQPLENRRWQKARSLQAHGVAQLCASQDIRA